MKSNAKTIDDYLSEASPDRRDALEFVRAIILANLPDGYEEVMNWGMITYQVPLAVCPDTYNGITSHVCRSSQPKKSYGDLFV